MGKKPSLTISKENKLETAKRELLEEIGKTTTELKRTTVILEPDLLYSVKEIGLKRKRAGITPNTLTGIVSEALQDFVSKELK